MGWKIKFPGKKNWFTFLNYLFRYAEYISIRFEAVVEAEGSLFYLFCEKGDGMTYQPHECGRVGSIQKRWTLTFLFTRLIALEYFVSERVT